MVGMRNQPGLILFFVAVLPLMHGCGKKDASEKPPESCVNISGKVEGVSVLMAKPNEDTAACIETIDPIDSEKAFCTKKAEPDFSCLGQADPDAGPSVSVSMRGCVDAFGLGGESHGLTVTVFREKLPDGTMANPGYDLEGVPGSQTDNTPGAFIARGLSTQVPPTECQDEGFFELKGVPTGTNLVVRVTEQSVDKDSRQFVDTYQYNVRLSNGAIKDSMGMPVSDINLCTPESCFVSETVNTITITTFLVIPPTARVSSILGSDDLFDGFGQGHIAGEVQDCSSVDTVKNAVVGIDVKAKQRTYFNVDFPPDRDNLADPKAEVTRTMTNADGLFTFLAVDTENGATAVKIAAAITPKVCGEDGICQCLDDGEKNPAWSEADAQEGEVSVLGERSIFVFPDSITLMSFDRAIYFD